MKGAWQLWAYFPRTFRYLRPYWRSAVVTMCLTLVTAVMALAQPWPIALLVDSVIGHHKPPALLSYIIGPEQRGELLIFVALASLSLTLLGNGVTVLNNYVESRVK